jgi:hypothetical protein
MDSYEWNRYIKYEKGSLFGSKSPKYLTFLTFVTAQVSQVKVRRPDRFIGYCADTYAMASLTPHSAVMGHFMRL